ncbi:MAG: sulfatase-like hydrolase/transferase, partial [Actinobacteria bacterium]|nr:sulfatase-like hydrolase/transferase [Actinomycetota bacterium]
IRDPLIADRVVRWLEDRYARRRAGDPDALRPFLLVASFVNPHDIVLFPLWLRKPPLLPSGLEPPPVPEPTTAHEDLASKPAAQIAYRTSYPSAYGPAPVIERMYSHNAQAYRDLYLRLHAEVDPCIDRVRAAVTGAGANTVLVRTADHGELLGAHGGLHQKWFNLYDEATRVPFVIARVGENATTRRSVDAPTSHVDLVPTLLAAAGIDAAAVHGELAEHFSEVHPLPGRNLMGVVDSAADADRDRTVYLMTRDNMLEGDSLASGFARKLGRADNPPKPLRIQVPAHVGANFEAVVARVDDADVPGGAGHLWKLVRTFDDPATWTEPYVRHLAASPPTGDCYRSEPLADEWELYDLDDDAVEATNRAHDLAVADVRRALEERLRAERQRSIPERHRPWPYARRHPTTPERRRPRPQARVARSLLRRAGLHPDAAVSWRLPSLVGHRVVVVATNHGVLEIGKPTGVFASELTVPYYAFLDAGAVVDVASPAGGVIPVDPLSLRGAIRTAADDRFLDDDDLRVKVTDSAAVADLDPDAYSIVYLAGGWGAAFDLGTCDALGTFVSSANARHAAIGGICHGPLGLLRATGTDGQPIVQGRRISAVTDKQVAELGIDATPLHPETELRAAGARFEARHAFRDVLANHWVVDGNLVTGQNQNAGPMVACELARLAVASEPT